MRTDEQIVFVRGRKPLRCGRAIYFRRPEIVNAVAAAGYHGLATFIGFIAAGIVPLLAYMLPWFDGARFAAAIALALGTLFVVGATRAFFTSRGWLASSLEMLLLGSFAALVAYCIGAIGAAIIGNTDM